jgi:threonyl-tRNA synthetase
MLKEVYGALGLDNVRVAVSTRGEKFIGTPEHWDVAEEQLVQACRNAGYEPQIKPGDAAFYAPKVEVDVLDVLGRVWTLGTIQLDMAMPDRFGLRYTAPDGSDAVPEMLHRAILGSLERFIAIYLEHTAGDFPLWLAPVQVVVLPITERHAAYGAKVTAAMKARGLRVYLDDRSEKLGYKIREAEVGKIPVMLVVGDQEEANGTVAPRRRHVEGDGEAVALDVFAESLAEETRERRS